MVYCPYTDSEISAEDCSSEHILPLSLGGINGIELPVSRSHNSKLGSEIDGAVANDFFVMMRRNRFDIRGHSGRRPVFVAKRSSDATTGAPLQVELDQYERRLGVWDPVGKQALIDGAPEILNLDIQVRTDIELRFVAKVALSAGYFAYGDLFRRNVEHEELRQIMNFSMEQMGDRKYSIRTLGDDRLIKPTHPILQRFRDICKSASPYSLIGLVPGNNSLTTFVGILGDYLGMLNSPANTSMFPNDGDFHWGHVILFDKSSGAKRMSFKEAEERLLNALPP